VFSTPLLPQPSWPQILSSAPSAHTSPSMWAPCFTPTQDYSCLYFWIADCKTKDSAPNDSKHSPIQTALIFFLNRIFIQYGFFQISELFHPFKGTTINLNVCRCTYECFGAEYCAHNLTVDVAKFTIQTPFSLLSWCGLSLSLITSHHVLSIYKECCDWQYSLSSVKIQFLWEGIWNFIGQERS